jgi:hypothetical protein
LERLIAAGRELKVGEEQMVRNACGARLYLAEVEAEGRRGAMPLPAPRPRGRRGEFEEALEGVAATMRRGGRSPLRRGGSR